jgi:hypothetical protein
MSSKYVKWIVNKRLFIMDIWNYVFMMFSLSGPLDPLHWYQSTRSTSLGIRALLFILAISHTKDNLKEKVYIVGGLQAHGFGKPLAHGISLSY